VADEQPTRRKSRRDRFVEIASRRTRQVIKHIRLLGNCANRSAYEYSDSDVAKIFDTIERELHDIRTRFKPGNRRKEVEFSIE
jgi:hypothetical protein